jgi:hypothetical protein
MFPWVGSTASIGHFWAAADAAGRSLTCPLPAQRVHRGSRVKRGRRPSQRDALAPLTREGCTRRRRGPDLHASTGTQSRCSEIDPRKRHKSQKNAAFSRMGAHGIAQVNTTGLIAAAFDHRDSRAGDPNLHTHLVISNKVQAIGADGIPRWLALDGTPLHHATVAASEFYNTRIEALLIAKLGVRFAEAPTKPGKRPVREIVGMIAELIEKYSSRSAAIDHRVGQLAKQFQVAHGREPTVVEMLALSQQATLETRQAKHEPRSLAEQRHAWRTQAIEVVGSQRALTKLIADITNAGLAQHVSITDEWVREQAAAVIATVAQTRATWTVNHVRRPA